MNGSKILGMAVAQPPTYSQASIAATLGYADVSPAYGIFAKSGIARRGLGISPRSAKKLGEEPKSQFDHVTAVAERLGIAALETLFEQEAHWLRREMVSALVVTTSSALTMPGLSSPLSLKTGFRPDIQRYDLVGMGCAGALPTLSLADMLANDDPVGVVIAVVVEVGSQAMRPATDDKGRAVVNSLFGDAAVAMVVGQMERPGARMVRARRNHSKAPESCAYATLICEDSGSRIPVITKETPAEGAALLLPCLRELHTWTLEERPITYALHPGGRAVLDRLQAELALTDAQAEPSRWTLSNFGNVIGCTALVALARVLEAKPAGYTLLGVIGPGLAAGAILLEHED